MTNRKVLQQHAMPGKEIKNDFPSLRMLLRQETTGESPPKVPKAIFKTQTFVWSQYIRDNSISFFTEVYLPVLESHCSTFLQIVNIWQPSSLVVLQTCISTVEKVQTGFGD
mmetsp:Transcript_13442/g.32412  ORF Transcript_13442/g.32412 Transcript_13442/m.32412 type:complete len:111 (-) Transcript_13442:34-366(-)